MIAGFALMQTRSRDEMVEWTKRFLAIAGDGECEIHRLSDVSPIDMVNATQAPCDGHSITAAR